jgi:hypothetical protein
MGTIVAGTTRAVGGITSIIQKTGEGLNGALSLLAWPFALIGQTAGLLSDSLAGGEHASNTELVSEPVVDPKVEVELEAGKRNVISRSKSKSKTRKSPTKKSRTQRSRTRRSVKKSKNMGKRSMNRKRRSLKN